MLGGCGQMKLRNAITQRETLVCSQIILNKGWYSVSFLSDKRGRGNKYYVVPAAKTRHQWLCPPCLIHLSPWQEILDIVGGSYARFSCVSFFQVDIVGEKSVQQPTMDLVPLRESMLKAQTIPIGVGLQRRKKHPMLSLSIASSPRGLGYNKTWGFCVAWKTSPFDSKTPLPAHVLQFHRGGLPSGATPLCL